MPGDVDGSHLVVGDLDAGWIEVVVDLGANGEACLGLGGGDQFDDDLMADEGLCAPVLGDEREEQGNRFRLMAADFG